MATNERVFNFSAGPSTLPVEVLEKAAAEMLNANGHAQADEDGDVHPAAPDHQQTRGAAWQEHPGDPREQGRRGHHHRPVTPVPETSDQHANGE